ARALGGVDESVRRVAFVLIGGGIAGTLACLLALFALVRFSLAPVRDVANRIAQIRTSDLSARIADIRTPVELRPIVERLDEMLARVAAAFSRERELTAEVAHELRTPLAGLRATIEVALDRERPADRYRSALTDCLTITVQTERMVTALLSLARLDAGSVRLAREPVAIDELVRDVIAAHTTHAAERQLTIATELTSITRTTDREQMRVAVGNLVHNAVSYAPAGSTIDIGLTERELRVANDGCTLAPTDAGKVFERFWRGDSARTGGTHAGLGLALCKKLVELLGGTIEATIEGSRFIVTVRLP
ncbi:MAG: sensor histidine kinase, partial [Kofleriaceae bacterium]